MTGDKGCHLDYLAVDEFQASGQVREAARTRLPSCGVWSAEPSLVLAALCPYCRCSDEDRQPAYILRDFSCKL